MIIRKTLLLSLTTLAFLANANGEAENQQIAKQYIKNVGGYTQIKLDTKAEQKYPLLKTTNVTFPGTVKYIGQSLNYLLSLTGYTLTRLDETQFETLRLYAMKLPLTNRIFANATTIQIIETIIGTGFSVSVDELTRTLTITKTQ